MVNSRNVKRRYLLITNCSSGTVGESLGVIVYRLTGESIRKGYPNNTNSRRKRFGGRRKNSRIWCSIRPVTLPAGMRDFCCMWRLFLTNKNTICNNVVGGGGEARWKCRKYLVIGLLLSLSAAVSSFHLAALSLYSISD